MCGALTVLQEAKMGNVSYIYLPMNDELLVPSIVKAPKLELKPLPDHLKYAFLGDGDELPVIIAKNLTPVQEDRLLRGLKEHKTAIGWTISDIKGIGPSMCMHRILREYNVKPVRDAQ